MIWILKALLGNTYRDYPAKKPAPSAGSKSSRGGGDYRAFSLAPSSACCAAAKDARRKRHLLREAPRLPLADCTMPMNCACKFRKYTDRRDGVDRRPLGATERNHWYSGRERRMRGGRRSTEEI
jgi:hypothetical protein